MIDAIKLSLRWMGMGDLGMGLSRFGVAGCALSTAIATTSALATEPPTYTILRTSGKIVVDGKLDEPAWKTAKSVGDFSFPWWKDGVRESTTAKLLWDDEMLYVSFECKDAHVWSQHTERDSEVYEDDCVEVFTAPDIDQPDNYFNIEMNVGGSFLDEHHPDGPTTEVRTNWNGRGIQIATTVDGSINDDADTDDGWILEAAIPLANFSKVAPHVPPKPGDTWRLNLNRLGGQTNPQFSQWSPGEFERPNFHLPQAFGRVVFASELSR